MKLPKIRELIEAIRALIVGPYTSKFPKAAHTPYPKFRGKPKFNDDKCVGCLACEEVCPVNAITHEDNINSKTRKIIHHGDTCIFCGQCQANCLTEEGIKLSQEWDLACFDRSACSESVDKELVLCECCGDVVAAKKHILWLAERLKELAYSNPTLYLTRLRELGIADNNLKDKAQHGPIRLDRIKVLCARCRRKTTLSVD